MRFSSTRRLVIKIGAIYPFLNLWPAFGRDEIGIYGSIREFKAAAVANEKKVVHLKGRLTESDGGGAIYARTSYKPVHAGKIQTADGTWWEIANARLRPEMFGARADGLTDCSTAIIDTFSVGRPVDFGVGTYRIDRTVTIDQTRINSNVELAGLGPKKTVIKIENYQPGLQIIGHSQKKRSVKISGISIGRDHPELYLGRVGPKTIYISNGNGVQLSNIEEFGAIGFGIQLDYCENYKITGCYVHDHKGGSPHLSGTDGIHLYRCRGPGRVWKNEICRVGDDAISFGSFQVEYPTSDVECSENVINDVAGSIKLYGRVTRVRIFKNRVTKGYNGGVTLWDDRGVDASHDIEDVKIEYNIIEGCGGPFRAGGVYIVQPSGNGVQEMRNITIANNQIINCQNGVSLISRSKTKRDRNIEIRGNMIKNSWERGLFINNVIERAVISRNQIESSGLEAILLQNLAPGIFEISENNVVGFGEINAGGSFGIWLPQNTDGVQYVVTKNTVENNFGADESRGLVIAKGASAKVDGNSLSAH